MAYVLWQRAMHYNPVYPAGLTGIVSFFCRAWIGPFVQHVSHLTGYPLTLEDLKQFRQWGSCTQGHPERSLDHGIEVTTGPLGQRIGMAWGWRSQRATWLLATTAQGMRSSTIIPMPLSAMGTSMEGVASEAASFAGHLKLGKLIYLYDDNEVTLSASTQVTFTEDRAARFELYGWQTIKIENGNDLKAIEEAIIAAQKDKERRDPHFSPNTYRIWLAQAGFL